MHDTARESLHFERFFATSAELLCIVEEGSRILRANAAFRHVLGYPEETLLGESLLGLVHDDDKDAVRVALEQAAANEGAPVRRSARLRRRDRSYRAVLLSVRHFPGEGTSYIVGRDEGQADQHDKATRRIASILQEIQATAKVGGWELDCLTLELFWSDETYRLHEVPPDFTPTLEGAIGFYAPESVPVISEAVDACMKRGEPFDLELDIITAKQRRLTVRAAGGAVVEDGKIIRIFGSFQDISEAKRRERELAQKLDVIAAQKEAIHALWAPVIEVWDGVLALPVLGSLDVDRAAELTERLLNAVVRTRARFAVLDVTGVDVVDEATAEHLVRIIRAARLLGTASFVTGVRPALAGVLSSIGADFGGATTLRSIREAIEECIRRQAPGRALPL